MHMHYSESFLDSLILEDCPYGDLTTHALGIDNTHGTIAFFPRADTCTVSGTEPAAKILERCGLTVEYQLEDGTPVAGHPCLLRASGKAFELHRGWKPAQNILEYMTGIATRTSILCTNARKGKPDIAVAVTRKNFPGAKLLSLAAATDGGASVHRAGLSESILVFDRHTTFLTGQDKIRALADKIPQIRSANPEKRIIAEASTPDEALRIAQAGADGVQLDKFSIPDLGRTVRAIREQNPCTLILAAGGINAENAEETALQGPDVLVTSWIYFGKPQDIKVTFEQK